MLSFYRRRRAIFEIAIVAALSTYVFYELLLGKLFSTRSLDPGWYRDIGIQMSAGRELVESHGNSSVYFYPPSNAILNYLFSLVGEATAFRTHLVLEAAAFAVTLACWSSMLSLTRKPERFLAIALAVAASLYYVRIELKMHNVNLLTLGLTSLVVLTQRHAGISGLLYGLDIGLKPYGNSLLLPWLLWRRQYRWCLASGAALAAICFVLPALWFGAEGTIRLYGDWLYDLWVSRKLGFSLGSSIATLMGAAADAPAARLATGAVEVAWLAMLAAFFVSRRRAAPVGGLLLAAEVAAMLIAPLPLGYQQPGRACVFLAPMLVLAAVAIDESRLPRTRYSLLLVMLFVGIVPWLLPIGPPLWIATLFLCVASLLGLVIATRGAVDAPDPALVEVELRSKGLAPRLP
jgi:hypothetical protein